MTCVRSLLSWFAFCSNASLLHLEIRSASVSSSSTPDKPTSHHCDGAGKQLTSSRFRHLWSSRSRWFLQNDPWQKLQSPTMRWAGSLQSSNEHLTLGMMTMIGGGDDDFVDGSFGFVE